MFKIPDPELQIDFSIALSQIRNQYLQDALSATIKTLDIAELDRSLAMFVPNASLATLASFGLRGELMFPVPLVLAANARLLAYYRLLYGYSQKEFYASETGVSRFRSMEKNGKLSHANEKLLPELCHALADAGQLLLNGLNGNRISGPLFDYLTLLTLGAQFRGSANVKKGAAGIVKVFEAIHEIVKGAVTESIPSRIVLRNAADRLVFIEFAPDPDIIIRAEMAADTYRKLIAIEVKGGSDFSNIHNRIGEAEKSHQKARAAGYAECWTVVNVDKIDLAMARRESPTTNLFYKISDITSGSGSTFEDFRDRIVSLTGIRV